ncbi:TetR family transcriptional regulator [Leifsonia sp. Leaf336]|nr:TetR family transcriptional regulator [Leifsonia sp. Leaf336]
MHTQLPRLRADARDNRERIIVAARALFAQRGVDVGMREIARRAGVGPATLYRRFPTRQAVIDEVFATELDACGQIVLDACADPDPWRGFTSALHSLTSLNVRNRSFVDALTAASSVEGSLVAHRRELLGMLAQLARRAQKTGALRCDFAIGDLVLALRAGRGLASGDEATRDAAARRFSALLVDAFRASGH